MKVEVYQSEPGQYNLDNYAKAYQEFNWEEVEKSFSWYETEKMNMAYECIDRHVDSGKGDKQLSIIKKMRSEKNLILIMI